MEDFLAPMTSDIVAWETDHEETDHDRALADPNGWRTDPYAIVVDGEIFDLAETLWGAMPQMYLHLGAALLTRREYLGLTLPTSPDHPDYMPVMSQLRDAVQAWETGQQTNG